MLAAGSLLPFTMAGDANSVLRFAISESVIAEVNLNDARAAMQLWIKRMTSGLNVVMAPKLLNTTQDIHERTRKGLVDAVALNIIEFRPISEWLDTTQVVTSAGAAGMEQYVILVKQNSGIHEVKDLKGCRLTMLKTPQMCVAPAWVSTLLEDRHHGKAEQFFGPIIPDGKVSRVVLPVFFGQANACLTSKRGFDMMSELNPQVGRELRVVASSPAMVVNFYIFRKNYQNENREKFIKALLELRASPAGEQLAMLFQFNQLSVREGGCRASALGVLEAADRIRRKQET